jgi:hypothetical protein
MPVIPAIGRLKQEDTEFQVSLEYTVRPCLKKKKKKNQQKQNNVTLVLSKQQSGEHREERNV